MPSKNRRNAEYEFEWFWWFPEKTRQNRHPLAIHWPLAMGGRQGRQAPACHPSWWNAWGPTGHRLHPLAPRSLVDRWIRGCIGWSLGRDWMATSTTRRTWNLPDLWRFLMILCKLYVIFSVFGGVFMFFCWLAGVLMVHLDSFRTCGLMWEANRIGFGMIWVDFRMLEHLWLGLASAANVHGTCAQTCAPWSQEIRSWKPVVLTVLTGFTASI